MPDQAIPKKAFYPMFRGQGTIEFVEKEVPRPGRGQLLIQCKANALCGSDLGQASVQGGTKVALRQAQDEHLE